MVEKDYSVDGDDRAEWDLAWASMSHRRLPWPPKIDLADFIGFDLGPLVAITISEDPAELSNKVSRPSETCPVCGATIVGIERVAGTLHPTSATGFSCGVGVWVHLTCWNRCPDVGEPSPIPW